MKINSKTLVRVRDCNYKELLKDTDGVHQRAGDAFRAVVREGEVNTVKHFQEIDRFCRLAAGQTPKMAKSHAKIGYFKGCRIDNGILEVVNPDTGIVHHAKRSLGKPVIKKKLKGTA